MINVFVLLLGFLVACGDKDADTAVEASAAEVEETEEGSEEGSEESEESSEE